MPSRAVGGIRRLLMWSLIPVTAFAAWRGSAADDAGKAGKVEPPGRPDALDDLPRRGLARPAAALQGRSRVSAT